LYCDIVDGVVSARARPDARTAVVASTPESAVIAWRRFIIIMSSVDQVAGSPNEVCRVAFRAARHCEPRGTRGRMFA
jgi:hypothetical protein